MSKYDVIILGGGPAGLTAAIYATRGGLKTLLIDKMNVGGQAALTFEIENYPGFDNIDGITLTQNMFKSAEKFGLESVFSDVLSIELTEEVKKVVTASGTFEGDNVILCMGAFPKNLGVDSESRYIGRGISYCATCDGGFYRKKTVAIVGGGNSAFEEAQYLSSMCKKVYLIHRRDTFRASEASIEKVRKLENVEFILSSRVTELHGEEKLQKIVLQDNNGTIKELELDGVFVAIGRTPETKDLSGVALSPSGYILTDELMKTNLKNVYAAGDIREKFLRQVVTACADGAIAAEHIIVTKE